MACGYQGRHVETGKSQLGLYLREAREARGVSLAQAAAETRILQRYLVALEDGAYQHLPADVYTRGFIRNYAQYLHVPPEELIELYRQERGATDQIKVVPATRPPQTRSCLVPSALLVFIVVAVLVIGGYLVLNALGLTRMITPSDTGTATRPIATPTQLATPSLQPTLPDGSTAVPIIVSPTAPDQPAPTAGVTPTLAAPVTLQVRVSGGQSWIEIQADGVPQLPPAIQNDGFSQTFQAQREILIFAGNAVAVEVSFNNGPFERLGSVPGATARRSFYPQQ
jgi:cytoskeleton protein RodZ